ncbi:MAG: T9SS type A sorting domain-containing protein [Hyphomicrobiales bacterium]
MKITLLKSIALISLLIFSTYSYSQYKIRGYTSYGPDKVRMMSNVLVKATDQTNSKEYLTYSNDEGYFQFIFPNVREVALEVISKKENYTPKLKDACLVNQYAFAEKTLTKYQLLSADINQDNKVNVEDSYNLMESLIGKYDLPEENMFGERLLMSITRQMEKDKKKDTVVQDTMMVIILFGDLFYEFDPFYRNKTVLSKPISSSDKYQIFNPYKTIEVEVQLPRDLIGGVLNFKYNNRVVDLKSASLKNYKTSFVKEDGRFRVGVMRESLSNEPLILKLKLKTLEVGNAKFTLDANSSQMVTKFAMKSFKDIDIPNIIVSENGGFECEVFPNPITKASVFKGYSNNGGELSFNVTDLTGRVIKTGTKYIEKGNFNIDFNLEELSKGIYLVNFILNDQSGQETKNLKIIVE